MRWLGLLLTGACAPSLESTLDPGPAGAGIDRHQDPVTEVLTSPGDSGADPVVLRSLTLDCTDYAQWVGLDLLTLLVDDASAWLDFRRFEVELREGVEATWQEGEDLAAVVAPADGWRMDDPSVADGRVFDLWYDYDPDTHLLTPKPRIYFVRSEWGLVALRFDSYYDPAGTPARIGLTLRTLEESP